MTTPESAPKAEEIRRSRGGGIWRFLGTTLGPLMALASVVAFFGVADTLKAGDDTFLTVANLRTIAVHTAPVAVAALGMTIIIIAGGIDLSAGTALALCATVMAHCLNVELSVGLAIFACLATGIVAGLLNGLLISALRVVPFIVTLGTMTVYLGIAKLIAKETTIRPPLKQIPDWLPALVDPTPKTQWLITDTLPNFASGVWLALVLAVLLAALLRYSVFGRYVFALGSNESTARLCGIPVPLYKIAVYGLAGLFIGIAGVYQFAKLSSGNPIAGTGQELKFIAAVVIGGGSLSGGRGSVLGTLTGAAIMTVITNGCTMLGIKNPVQDILIGVIIIGAVTVDQIRQRRLLS